jgi:hypothetical protein
MLALAYVLRDLQVGLSAETALEAEDAAGEPLTSGAALQKARTFSTGGDYRTAVRYLYLSTLLLLDERGVLTYDRALTNREYARGLASAPHLARLFSSVVDVFDRVWYGEQPLDRATYEDYAEKSRSCPNKNEAAITGRMVGRRRDRALAVGHSRGGDLSARQQVSAQSRPLTVASTAPEGRARCGCGWRRSITPSAPPSPRRLPCRLRPGWCWCWNPRRP